MILPGKGLLMAKYQIIINKLKPKTEHWRDLAEYWHISAKAKERLEWIIFYHTVSKKNATSTANYFGISRKTFHKWRSRFNPKFIQSLEGKSRRPHKLRTWQVTSLEEARIVKLRKRYLKYGKVKLKVLYKRQYQKDISTWKIERVVRKHNLYPDPTEHKRQVKKRKNRGKRARIHKMDTKRFKAGKLWHTDTIEVRWYGTKRYIITAIEDKTKLGYARVYKNHSSRSAADFLKRLVYLSRGDISVIHSDNGSEFAGEFEKAVSDLHLFQVYSRVRTPNDNPSVERFNRTIREEWLALSEIGLDNIEEANDDLTEWLVEYNSIRPHQTLDYLTPIEYAHHNYFKVLPMWPASTPTINMVI